MGHRRRRHASGDAIGVLVAQQRDVYALGLVVIAWIYVGFAVADRRRKVIAVESGVAFVFIVVNAAAIAGSPPLSSIWTSLAMTSTSWPVVRLRHQLANCLRSHIGPAMLLVVQRWHELGPPPLGARDSRKVAMPEL